MREMWTYSDGVRTVKARWRPGDTGRAGRWVLVDPSSGDVRGTAAAGEFSRRFRPVDVFADVPALANYLGTVTAADGTALVDLMLDRNPFMLANGRERAARPHALMVPRRHRDGWSSATAQELAARRTAMSLVAVWYRSLDDGHVVFCANDSAPNLDYQRDVEAANAISAGPGTGAAVRRNPRQEVQHAHLHAFYAEDDPTENHEAPALNGHLVVAQGRQAFDATLGGDAVQVDGDGDSDSDGDGVRVAARPWGGSYCSYQLGVDGPFSVMPALGVSQDEFNRRLARADGLRAEPDPKLGGAVNLLRPSLDDAERRDKAGQATAEQRSSFEAFVAKQGLNARSLPAGLATG
jgi:hypothetical protein